MKKIILILILGLNTALIARAQDEKNLPALDTNSTMPGVSEPVKNYDYYVKKSKEQSIRGCILLGAATALIAIAAPGNISFDAVGTITIGAGLLTIVGIGSLIGSGNSKRKARLMLANQKVKLFVPGKKEAAITGIALSIPLGR